MEAISTRPAWGPAFSRGKGPWLIDEEGAAFFDATSGSGAATLGHQHPAVTAAAVAQMGQLIQTGCKFGSLAREQFVTALCDVLPYRDPAVLPTATGAEAVETALKVARAATGSRVVVCFRYGYHGKTAGALELTWRADFKGYSPESGSGPAVLRAELPDPRTPLDLLAFLNHFDQVLAAAAGLGGLAAVVVEPVQVTEGVLAVAPAVLEAIALRTRAAGGLFVLDEIYTGLGRAGWMYYGDQLNAPPDVMILGKTLGNGFPIAAVTAEHGILDSLPAGVQTSTFSGHPVSCAAAAAVIEVAVREQVPQQAAALGGRLAEDLAKLADGHSWIESARSVGGLGAFDCVIDGRPAPDQARKVAQAALRQHLLIFAGGPEGSTVKLVPPVLLADGEYEALMERLITAVERTEPAELSEAGR